MAPGDLTPAGATVQPVASPVAIANPVRETSPFGEVVWAAASDPATNAPIETVSAYSPDAPRITASVLADGLPAGATIEAAWQYNNTSLDAFTRQIVTSAPTAQTWLSFHIDRDPETPWPVGVYEVIVSLDGSEIRHASVEVAPQA
ncbi:MAG: hypothetical protein ACRDJC_21705 [Thermomicrobiales bacterium]